MRLLRLSAERRIAVRHLHYALIETYLDNPSSEENKRRRAAILTKLRMWSKK